MKTSFISLNLSVAAILGVGFLVPQSSSADVTKTNNSVALNNGLSWVEETVPGSNDVVVFNSTLDLHSYANSANPVPREAI